VGTSPRDVRAPVDLRDASSIARLVECLKPDVVIHTAVARDDVRGVIEQGTVNLVRSLAPIGARLIHVSSDAVFKGAETEYLEADTPEVTFGYGGSKARAETTVRSQIEDHAIVRTSLLLGGPQNPSTHEIRAANPTTLHWSDYVRRPLLASDLASALVELAMNDFIGTLNVAGPCAASRAQLAQAVQRRAVLTSVTPAGTPRNVQLSDNLCRHILRTRIRDPLNSVTA
jgi:dTDP-4-dehydrorhamnose reductase